MQYKNIGIHLCHSICQCCNPTVSTLHTFIHWKKDNLHGHKVCVEVISLSWNVISGQFRILFHWRQLHQVGHHIIKTPVQWLEVSKYSGIQTEYHRSNYYSRAGSEPITAKYSRVIIPHQKMRIYIIFFPQNCKLVCYSFACIRYVFFLLYLQRKVNIINKVQYLSLINLQS